MITDREWAERTAVQANRTVQTWSEAEREEYRQLPERERAVVALLVGALDCRPVEEPAGPRAPWQKRWSVPPLVPGLLPDGRPGRELPELAKETLERLRAAAEREREQEEAGHGR